MNVVVQMKSTEGGGNGVVPINSLKGTFFATLVVVQYFRSCQGLVPLILYSVGSFKALTNEINHCFLMESIRSMARNLSFSSDRITTVFSFS